MYKATNRKAAARRLSELTGMDAVYTRMPRCAYEIGGFTIERDGTVVMEDGADLSLLETLAQEGLVERIPESAEMSETAGTSENPPERVTLSEAAEQAQDEPGSVDDAPRRLKSLKRNPGHRRGRRMRLNIHRLWIREIR